MKVLVVADVLGEENNGTTIACMNLVRYMSSQGDDVKILCADRDKKGNHNYFVVPELNLGYIINYFVHKNNVVLAKPTKKIIRKALDGVDVVHIMMPFALGRAALKEARKRGIPVTAGFHCQAENFTSHLGLMNVPLANNLTYKNFYNHFYKYVDAIHYPTDFIREYFERVIKRKTNAYVISNGVNHQYKKYKLERKGKLANHFNILFIGRYSKEKTHPLLIKAVSLSKHKDDIQLIFAGQGPYANSMKKLSKELGIIPPIMKFYSRQDLVKVINSCDLYVHPAEIEIEAISCLEAITCGLVPVISDSERSATNKFALSEKNLFKYDSPEDLANKIDYWIEHPEEKEECSKQYLGYTKQFEQKYCMEKTRNMILSYTKKDCYTTQEKRYYQDEINDDFANNGIVAKHNKVGYKYIHKNIFFRFFSTLLRTIARPLIWLMNKIVYKQKIVNKKILKKYKKSGYFIYANHTTSMGDAYTPNILSRKNYILVGEEATSIPFVRTIVSMLGALPIPYHSENIKPFLDSVQYYIKDKKASITIYPEAHIWPTYTKIRNFKHASFRYPVDLNVPCFSITNTYRPGKNPKKPKLVSIIDGPFYPNPSLNRADAIKDLRDQIYENMVKRAAEVPQIEQIRYIKVEK